MNPKYRLLIPEVEQAVKSQLNGASADFLLPGVQKDVIDGIESSAGFIGTSGVGKDSGSIAKTAISEQVHANIINSAAEEGTVSGHQHFDNFKEIATNSRPVFDFQHSKSFNIE